MSNATARGATVKVTLPLADLRALAEEAERLRTALDGAEEAIMNRTWRMATEIIAKARRESVLYDECQETP